MPSESGSIKRVLRNQGFLRLWILQGTTQTAQNMINFSLLILVREIIEKQNISQANTAISLMVLAFSAPAIVFSPIAGVVVERTDKRTIMIVANGLRALAVLAFLALDPAWPAVLTLTALYTITFFLGAVGQFFGPAQLAAIPVIVRPRDLISANALFNLTFTGSQVLGFALFGPLAIKLLGTQTTLVGILFLYIATTGLAMLIPSTPPSYQRKNADEQHPFRQFAREAREGLGFVAERPLLIKSIIYLTLATTTYLMIAALGPEFISSVLGLPAEDIAYIVAPAGLGVVTGALLVNRVTKKVSPVRLVDLGLIGAGLSLALFALTEPVGSALGLSDGEAGKLLIGISIFFAATLGICNAFILVPSQAIMQRAAPEEGVARVYATYFTISNIFSFAPVLFAGAIADIIGVMEVMVAIAVLLALTGLYNLGRPAHPLPDDDDRPTVPA
jgi:MFS family permease